MQDTPQTKAADPARQVRIGIDAGYVDLRVDGQLLLVEVVGAAGVAQVREALATGRQAGWLGAAMPTLVDLSQFSGNVDWGELHTISRMADWPPTDGRSLPVAYVSDATLFALLMKLVQVFFPWARHRAFSRRDWALDWLREQCSAPQAGHA